MQTAIAPQELRPTVMQVDLSALTYNLQTIRAHVGDAKVMAVIKANAYGHGLVECARQLAADGADYFGVALVEEGIELRRAGIHTPILVFGGIWGAQIHHYLDYDLDITASSADKLRAIDEAAAAANKRARVHLKIDTGLGRIGVQWDRLPPFADAILTTQHCDIIGVFSHFATADESDQTFAHEQLRRFQTSLDYLRSHGITWRLAHMANSAAILTLPESTFGMVRAGIALYGVAPNTHLQNTLPLRAAMELKSKVVYFKVISAGQGISYGQHWHAARDTRIVTVPVGYGDGYFRRLSGRGEVLIRGRRHPIVGNVCMDQMMVDIGPDGEAYNGDDVVLIGAQDGQKITVAELAEVLETTPHEILTSTNLRVPRVYIN